MRTIKAIACAAIAAAVCEAATAQKTRATVDIEAQPLRSALKELGEQTGLQIVFRVDDLARETANAPRVAGELAPSEALQKLLAKSRLQYQFVNPTTVLISSSNEAAAKKTAREATQSQEFEPPSSMASTAQSTPEEGLKEVLVTAQKRIERLKDVPIQVSVLQGADLDSSSLVSVTDALNRVPGVVALESFQGGGTRVSVRGVGSSAPLFTGSSPIGYYLDSVPFGLVKSAIAPDQGAYDLQRIEVLRGPQGTLYGASAENGLVRVLTNDANLDQFELKARATASSTAAGGDNYRGDLAVNIPILPGKLAVRAVVGDESLSGWIDSPNKRDVNDATLRNYRLKVNAQPTDAFSIGLSAWRADNDYGAPSTSDANGRIPTAQNQAIATAYDSYGLKLGYQWSTVSLSSMTSYLDYHNDSTLGQNFGGTPDGLELVTGLNARVFSQEVLLNSSSPESPWKWTGGVFYRDATDRLVQVFAGVLPLPVDYSNSSRSGALFGELGRRFFDRHFEWTLGLRYFHDTVGVRENTGPAGRPLQNYVDEFHATTPRAVLSWYPNNDMLAYASYSEGFRSGFHQSPDVALSHPEIPALKPDKLHNYEIGTKADFLHRRLSVDAAVYYIDWKDVQQTLNVASLGTYVAASVNGESASGIGVDLGLTARPLRGLDVSLTFAWNNLELDKPISSSGVQMFNRGDRLNLSPAYTVGAAFDYTFGLGGSGYNGRFSASGNYSDAMDTRFITAGALHISRGDPILITRTSFSVDAPHHWTATLFGDNLNNERGAVVGNASIPSWAARVRPRTIGVQFDYSF